MAYFSWANFDFTCDTCSVIFVTCLELLAVSVSDTIVWVIHTYCIVTFSLVWNYYLLSMDSGFYAFDKRTLFGTLMTSKRLPILIFYLWLNSVLSYWLFYFILKDVINSRRPWWLFHGITLPSTLPLTKKLSLTRLVYLMNSAPILDMLVIQPYTAQRVNIVDRDLFFIAKLTRYVARWHWQAHHAWLQLKGGVLF